MHIIMHLRAHAAPPLQKRNRYQMSLDAPNSSRVRNRRSALRDGAEGPCRSATRTLSRRNGRGIGSPLNRASRKRHLCSLRHRVSSALSDRIPLRSDIRSYACRRSIFDQPPLPPLFPRESLPRLRHIRKSSPRISRARAVLSHSL